MSQPDPYVRLASFAAIQAASPSTPLPGNTLDAELNAVKFVLDQILTNLELIQRDDTKVANRTVHPQAFDSASLAFIASDWLPRGDWATTTNYDIGDVVEEASESYVCAVAHTSGVFATDDAAGYWVQITQAITADVRNYWGGTAGGSANAITITTGDSLSAYVSGHSFSFLAAADNTGAVTLDVDSVGPLAIQKHNAGVLAEGEIKTGHLVTVVYDGTVFRLATLISSSIDVLGNQVDIYSAASGATSGPNLNLRRTKTGADGDELAEIRFKGKSDAAVVLDYGTVKGTIRSAVEGAEYGGVTIAGVENGTLTDILRLNQASSGTVSKFRGLARTPLDIDRITDFGDTLRFLKDGTNCGKITSQTGNKIALYLSPSANVFISTGTGTPEAVVTAGIGSLFLRQDGGASTTLYVKLTGAGSTGWAGVAVP